MTAPDVKTGLTDLPTDILLSIIPYLGPKDLLALCSTSRAFVDLRLDPSYWRRLTCATYRLPNQPLLRSDGARWRALYQRLQNQSRVYTWGRSGPRLGRHFKKDDPIAGREYAQGHRDHHATAWPTEICDTEGLGPIVDVQCGGWSTTVLTSNGELYTAGTIENAFQNASVENLERLKVSSQHPRGADRLAAMTVSQFSSGRSHILALSDAGDVWFWWLKMSLGWKLTFLHCDVPDIGQSTGNTAPVTRVVAGWDCSSAFVPGKGILVWKIPQELYRRPPVQDGAPQATLAVEDSLVPSTHYQRPKRRARHASNEDEQLGKDVGEVTGYVALEGFIVFLTDLGKVFAAKYANSETLARGILELDGFEPSDGKAMMTHIEGSFRSFAVFNTDGDVVLGDCDQLDRTWKARYEPDTMGGASTIPRPVRPAALQNRGVISLAFGDWHKLALTAEGDILSFGREPQSCGSLGLGRRIGEGFLRGVRSARQIPWLDGESMGRWRRIFFSPEQREWLRYMGRGGLDAAAGLQAMAELERNEELHLKSADWFEEKGADWDRHPNLDTLGQPEASTEPAYKVVSISAAGWHCGAIVLADDEKIRRMYEAHAGFLPIPGGSESSDIVSRAWNRFSAMWKGSSETPQSQTPPTTDHLLGRDHRYYYSDERWEVVSQKIPEEARHEVRFPVFQDVPAQQEL